jgi:hypothetical protein
MIMSVGEGEGEGSEPFGGVQAKKAQVNNFSYHRHCPIQFQFRTLLALPFFLVSSLLHLHLLHKSCSLSFFVSTP